MEACVSCYTYHFQVQNNSTKHKGAVGWSSGGGRRNFGSGRGRGRKAFLSCFFVFFTIPISPAYNSGDLLVSFSLIRSSAYGYVLFFGAAQLSTNAPRFWVPACSCFWAPFLARFWSKTDRGASTQNRGGQVLRQWGWVLHRLSVYLTIYVYIYI